MDLMSFVLSQKDEMKQKGYKPESLRRNRTNTDLEQEHYERLSCNRRLQHSLPEIPYLYATALDCSNVAACSQTNDISRGQWARIMIV